MRYVTLTRKGGRSSVRICEGVNNRSPDNWGSSELWIILLASFSCANTCMGEDSGGGDLAEQLPSLNFSKMFLSLQRSVALLS